MYDPDLHIFATDDDILCCYGLQRMWHTVRKEFTKPVYTPDEMKEGPGSIALL